MKIFALHCLVVLCLGIVNRSVAQTAGSDSILSFQTMHVHFDKDIYVPGETIWFKAYLYNVNEISYSATNFYVAIYDEKGKIIQQKQYPVLEGSCSGDFEIPDTIESSRIQFRAFTKAMVIEDSNNVYQTTLKIYKKENNQEAVFKRKRKILEFFPEGGQIVAELQNYIAFKATYGDGSPAMVRGQIVEAAGSKIVDSFFTNNLGLGQFILIPTPYKDYLAIFNDDDGVVRKVLLPAINRYGASFHAATKNKEELEYTVAKNNSKDNLSVLHIMAQMGNYKLYKADLTMANEMEMTSAKFSIKDMPAGLMQINLFDKDWNILQERILFINNYEKDKQPVIKRDTINTGPKGKNTIEISLADTSFTNLSVSIADANFYQPDKYSIRQDLLLNTQLKELFVDVDSVLQNDNYTSIDLLTLTHPWKKYKWQNLINKDDVTPELLDNYISLTVKYTEKNAALPQDDALNLIITGNGSKKEFYTLKPASPTSFKKSDLLFFDSVKVSYQMNLNKALMSFLTMQRDSGLKIPNSINALPKQTSLAAVTPAAGEVTAGDNFLDSFKVTIHKKFNDVQTIQRVVVKSRYKGNPVMARIEELDDRYATGMFKGTIRGFQLNVIDDSVGAGANGNLQDYIRYRVPGVSVLDGDIGFKKRIESTSKKGAYIMKDTIFQCVVFVDELEVEGSYLQLMNMANVAYVKYIPGIVIGGSFKSIYGAIYVYTKNGNEKGPPLKGLPFVYVKGYSTQKEFNNPDYTDKTLLQQPDIRSTVYWNPNVIMDKANNKVKIEFYNNDISKKLLLKIEGVNAEGKIIYLEKVLE